MAAPLARGIMQGGAGRATLLGGSIVAAGLSGFYLHMHHNKQKQEAAGTNPYFEQVMAHVGKQKDDGEVLQPLRSYPSEIPPAQPGKDHYSGHATHSTWKSTQGYAEHGDNIRFMQPAPQRQGVDGKAYTKSPDYVKNYGKTQRPSSVIEV